MIKLILPLTIIVLLLASTSTSVRAGHRVEYPTRIFPVITAKGDQLGLVHVQRRGHLLYMDYDFDHRYQCRLENITTHLRNLNQIHSIDTREPAGRSLPFPNTYIAPNDAVVAFDLTGWPDTTAQYLSARLQLDCHSVPTLAWVSGDGHTWGDKHYLSYQAKTPHRHVDGRRLPTPTPVPIRTPKPVPTPTPAPTHPKPAPTLTPTPARRAPVDDGFRMVVNPHTGRLEWRRPGEVITPRPRVPATTRGPVDDGYRLVFNPQTGWLEWRRSGEAIVSSRQVPTTTGRAPVDDGYRLVFNRDTATWIWQNIFRPRSV
jgi:hypothetical protein